MILRKRKPKVKESPQWPKVTLRYEREAKYEFDIMLKFTHKEIMEKLKSFNKNK
jgi:hypothetical protein